jgi:hypothetical protein
MIASDKTCIAAIRAIQSAEYPNRKTSRLPDEPEWAIENNQRISAILEVIETGMVVTQVGGRVVPYASLMTKGSDNDN